MFFDESKIVREYDQEIPQSQTADNPMAPRGRAAQPSRDNRSRFSYLCGRSSSVLFYQII